MSFSTIISEGNLIPADLLEQIVAGEAEGQQPADFGLEKSRRLTDEIAAAWSDARVTWDAFQRSLRRRPEGTRDTDPATSITRERWVLPLLEMLGYRLTYTPAAAIVGGQTYAISHRAGPDENAPPLHVEGFRRTLDERPASGRPRLSPHALMQEYLNGTEHLWGIVTNGARLRLLRDSSRTSRPSYVEFDLQALFEGEKFAEFALLYRLLHRSRLPELADDAPRCLLERYHQQALEAGGRVRDGLRDGVQRALELLGSGLLSHPANAALREAVASGDLPAQEYYRQLLRLIYRLLFLMVAEERHLISGSERGLDLYREHYSVTRLRRLAEQPGGGRGHYADLWLGLLATFRVLRDDEAANVLGVTALDGDLFGPHAMAALEGTQLFNSALLAAVRALSLYRDPQSKLLRRVNYSALDVEELGSVYESLLDYRPVVADLTPAAAAASPLHGGGEGWRGGAGVRFELVPGTERKTTGSYYTRPELVHELIKSALEPVLEDRLQAAGADPAARARAILALTVCDPACGSGHFLLAAARRLGRELARVRSGEDQPNPEQFRLAVREVIAHCIYGVDLNPLAVDLCKLALWLEGFSAGMPLSFLDHHVRWGNSLVGASEDLVRDGIPDEAFKAVTGDDKAVATAFRKRNKAERENQRTGQAVMNVGASAAPAGPDFARQARALDDAPDSSVAAVRAKAAEYARLRGDQLDQWTRYNLWTAAFFTPLTDAADLTVPTSQAVFEALASPARLDGRLVGRANALALELGFFHWELEFRQVFGENSPGGFDVVLGNPPWERITLLEREHWVDVPEIRDAPNKSVRERILKEWLNSNELVKHKRYKQFEDAKYVADAYSRFVRASGRFPLTAIGDMNIYALFSELDRTFINNKGRTGVIVPTGIATDDTTKDFFSSLNENHQLISLYDFENREAIFPEVDSRMKFALLTFGRNDQPTLFMFFTMNVSQLLDENRRFTLTSSEIALLNPNTHTCPIFRTKVDAELTKKIYNNVPVLENEHLNTNPWSVSFLRMFDMSTDSILFQSAELEYNIPLYEAKMIQSYDHHASSVITNTKNIKRPGQPVETTTKDHLNPDYKPNPQYWVPINEVNNKVPSAWNRKWFLVWRRISGTTNERSFISTLIPYVGYSDSGTVCFPMSATHLEIACLLSILNSLVLDFITRQKMGGTSLSYFIVKQLPVLPPEAFSAADIAFIVPRVLELVYTAWDMQPFAEDVWAELDDGGRRAALAQNAECNAGAPAAWFSPRDGFALPPFQWSDERRAGLRAALDARIARLYGLTRDELRYILDPADVYGPDFPGETFRVLKEKETKLHGEYRTRRLVLAAWDREENQ